MSDLPPPEYDNLSVVLIGSFNPKIFQPAWFAAQGLIPAEEATTAKIRAITNDYCSFETEWFLFEAIDDRWMVQSTSTPAMEALRDLVIGTFKHLEHTPVLKMGVNSMAHFMLGGKDVWNAFGHRMVPKDELFSPVLKSPGTLSVTIASERPDAHTGHVNVKIESSKLVATGIFIEINDEFRQQEEKPVGWATRILVEEWEACRRRAGAIRSHIVKQGSGVK